MRRALLMLTMMLASLTAMVAGQAGAPSGIQKPNITPTSDNYVAQPLTVTTDKPLPNPYYLPNGNGCQQSIRLNTTGGYAPITWSLVAPTSSMDKWSLAPLNGVVETANVPPATGTSALAKKPAGS